MRNALLHGGSTTAQNLSKSHQTSYTHFSFVDPDTFDVTFHYTTNQSRTVLDVDIRAMAAETRDAIESWFNDLQGDPIKMSLVEQNIGGLTGLQPKLISVPQSDGSRTETRGLTRSST
jgi:hypothetical protein